MSEHEKLSGFGFQASVKTRHAGAQVGLWEGDAQVGAVGTDHLPAAAMLAQRPTVDMGGGLTAQSARRPLDGMIRQPLRL